MKSPIIRFVLTVICTFALGNAYAEGITIDGVYYSVIKKGKVATVGGAESNIRNAVIRDHITFEGVECNVTSIAAGAFNMNRNIQSVTIPNSVTSIGEYAFRYCSNLENVSIPNSVTSIGEDAFNECTSIRSIEIPNSVTIIENQTFYKCSNLISVSIPNSVTKINARAFGSCESLTDVEIPNSVIEIEYSAFRWCSSMKSLVLPKSLAKIGGGAFEGCPKLETVYCYAETPPDMPIGAVDIFENSYVEYATLYVPSSAIDVYRKSLYWSNFGTILPITECDKCESPIVNYADGRIYFSSSTEGCNFHYTITDEDTTTETVSNGVVNLNATLHISVYAEADGYSRSDITTATLCWIDGTLSSDGIEAARVEKRPIIVSNDGGTLHIKGVQLGESVMVYATNGMLIGSAIAKDNEVSLNAHQVNGSVAIIKVGENSVKVSLK